MEAAVFFLETAMDMSTVYCCHVQLTHSEDPLSHQLTMAGCMAGLEAWVYYTVTICILDRFTV